MAEPDCVDWCVVCCSWVYVQSGDDFLPYAYRTKLCGCLPLRHCGGFYPVLFVWNVGDNISARCRIPLPCGVSRNFL